MPAVGMRYPNLRNIQTHEFGESESGSRHRNIKSIFLFLGGKSMHLFRSTDL